MSSRVGGLAGAPLAGFSSFGVGTFFPPPPSVALSFFPASSLFFFRRNETLYRTKGKDSNKTNNKQSDKVGVFPRRERRKPFLKTIFKH